MVQLSRILAALFLLATVAGLTVAGIAQFHDIPQFQDKIERLESDATRARTQPNVYTPPVRPEELDYAHKQLRNASILRNALAGGSVFTFLLFLAARSSVRHHSQRQTEADTAS